MRVLVINPVGHPKWDEQDRRIYESFASPGTSVDVVSLPSGPPTVETPEALAEVIPLVVRLGRERCKAYDALIVNCFLDPGVDLLRMVIDKPVVGPCEASLALASILGGRAAIITVGNQALQMIEQRVRATRHAHIVTSIRGIPLGVMEIEEDLERTRRLLVEEGARAREEGADTVILGCTGLAGLARDVQEALGIPVIDPAGAALKMAESVVKLGLKRGG